MKRYSLLFIIILLNMVTVHGQARRGITETLPSRQVHLDFHTSEYIEGIGEKFDKKQFQEGLISNLLSGVTAFVYLPR